MTRDVLLFLLIFTGFTLSACNDYGVQPGDSDEGVAYDHQRNPGESAGDLLRDDTYTRLEIEIDYMPGYAPRSEAIDSLQEFLEDRLFKSDISFLIPTQVPSGNQETYSSSDIRDLERDYRNSHTSAGSDTLTVYMLFVDGEYEESNVLAIAHYNTSMAFFGETIADASRGFLSPPRYRIEGTVLQHEFGHLMGLVDNGTQMQSDHKTENSAHCTSDGCLMQPSVETTDYVQNLLGSSIPELDAFCLEDLQANGGR